jgi:hypothetical protein
MTESTTKEDIKRLMGDSNRLAVRIGKLEQDHAAWASTREETDIQELMKLLQQLETDVNVMAGDCFSLQNRDGGEVVEQDLHDAYVHLNILFEDVKKARTELEKAYIQPRELIQMEIDWGKLQKTVEIIARHLGG